jgi:murein DD-endopeptidase MepM/ murein hydrolase activator NlpD
MRPTVLRRLAVLAAGTVLTAGVGGSASAGVPAATVPAAGLPGPAVRSDDVTKRKSDLDRRLDQLREDLEGTADDLVEAAVVLKRSETALVTVRARLVAARAALAEAKRRDAALAADLAYAQAEEDKAVKALAAQAKAEADTRRRLGRIAREAYVGSGMTGLSIALQVGSPDQFADRMAVAGAALRSENSEVDRLVVVRSEMRSRTAKLAALRARTAELKRLAAAAVQARAAAEATATEAEAEQSRLVAAQSAALTVVRARQAQEKARLAQVEAEQARLSKILRDRAERARKASEARKARQARQAKPPSSGGGASPGSGAGGGQTRRDGYLSYPVDAPVTSGFGMRYHPVLHYWRLHAGTDFGVGCGTPVRAAAAGTVVRAGRAGGYGNQIVLDHGEVGGVGLATSYNHLSRIYAHGGSVSRGEVIGLSGTTGLSTGCHLHFEVYEDGTHVNPMKWL